MIIKRVLGLTTIITLISFVSFMVMEPQSASAVPDTITVSLNVTSEISITSPLDVTLLPAMAGMTGGSASGDATWTVKTSDSSGFGLTLKEADAAYALVGAVQGDSFSDYIMTAQASTPDYEWTIIDSQALFGFSVVAGTAADTVGSFLVLGAGTACGVGGANTTAPEKCWRGFSGTTEISIINRLSETDFAGQAEKVIFKAQLYNADSVPNDVDGFVAEDSYTTTITATATTN